MWVGGSRFLNGFVAHWHTTGSRKKRAKSVIWGCVALKVRASTGSSPCIHTWWQVHLWGWRAHRYSLPVCGIIFIVPATRGPLHIL